MVRQRKYARIPAPKTPRTIVEEPQYTPEKVKIHFNQPVELYINGTPFIGIDIEAPDYTVAAELVRNAREAYGRDII